MIKALQKEAFAEASRLKAALTKSEKARYDKATFLAGSARCFYGQPAGGYSSERARELLRLCAKKGEGTFNDSGKYEMPIYNGSRLSALEEYAWSFPDEARALMLWIKGVGKKPALSKK